MVYDCGGLKSQSLSESIRGKLTDRNMSISMWPKRRPRSHFAIMTNAPSP